ncbi:hypothetical protein AB5J62_10315 [Amycolatopsis sp. cg5]|uniref:hypothetical protein n=1 Tax=Amycolatopsis sp. cg5 TaxID=3238802 RepID=UPI003524B4BF
MAEKRLSLNTWRPTIGYEGDIGTEARAAKFTFDARQPGAVTFEYSFDWGPFRVVSVAGG